MALLRLFDPTTQFQTKSGALNVAGKLRIYVESTDDLANIYGDDGSRLPQPLILDSNGRARGLFVDSGRSYRLEAYDRNDSLLFTIRRLEPNASGTIIGNTVFIKGTPDEIDVEDSVTEKIRTYTVSLSAKVKGKIDENREAIVKESEARKAALDDKVDKVEGKGLSTEDYTTADKTKLDGIAAGTASPLMDGKASVGNSLKYAREDHVHPSDTSREDIANKTTVVLGTSDSKYPTDKAVAEFVNSSIATNTANYISNNGEPFTSVEQLEAYSGTVTNNDYAFVTGTDSDGNTYYDRYKATVRGETVTWSLEYRLNNSSFTAAQWSAINSGITSVLVAKIHDHSNKDVLDGITSSDVANWNSKMDKQTVGNASEPVYLANGIAKVATNVATTGNLETKLNVDGSNATTAGVTAMMEKVPIGSDYLDDNSYYFGDIYDHTQIIRRPILNIWNYIKNKVQSQLLGSVGSVDKPIYLENGVPKVCADGVPYSEVSYGGNVGYGVFVGGAHNLAYNSRCYCTFLVSVVSYPDNIAHTYIGTFSFRGGILNCELKCLTGTPEYPLRIVVVSNETGKDSNGKPTYTVGLYVIPADKTYKYSSYKLTRIASTRDFILDVKAISEATYDECNSVAKPALKPIILTWDAIGSNVTTTGGTWIPSFDKATIIDCRGIVDMSIQVDLSIIGQSTYINDFTNYEITLVNSSKTDILPESLHQTGRMPRQTRSNTGGGAIDISHTHRFIFPITSTINLLAGYRPKITLPSRYTLDSGAQVNIKALCRGIVLPYGADEYF